MITVLIRTKEPRGSRTVHGVVYLDTPEGCVTDPERMEVVSRYPKLDNICQLAEERVPLMACVRNLKRLRGLPARETLEALRAPEGPGGHLQLEADPIAKPDALGRSR